MAQTSPEPFSSGGVSVIEGLESTDASRDGRLLSDVAIIGAGAAGLTAGYLLSKRRVPVTIFEADPVAIGGSEGPVNCKGFRLNGAGWPAAGGVPAMERLVWELLPGAIPRPATPRQYWRGALLASPTNPVEAFLSLSLVELAVCLLSLARARIVPTPRSHNLEQWLSSRWGRRFYSIFFKRYVEKVWGMECREIPKDWGERALPSLGVLKGILQSLRECSTALNRKTDGTRDGPAQEASPSAQRRAAMIWEVCADRVKLQGGRIFMGERVIGCAYNANRRRWRLRFGHGGDHSGELEVGHVISSAPLPDLAWALKPRLSDDALKAVASLRHRDRLTVAVIARGRSSFEDERCVELHDSAIKAARLLIERWSPQVVPDGQTTCYGLEYYCREGDALWISRDETLLEIARRDLERMGIGGFTEPLDGCVLRQKKAFPIDDDDALRGVAILRDELKRSFPQLHFVGCNGLHNNQGPDFAAMSASLCVENILAGKEVHDLWALNRSAHWRETGGSRERRRGRAEPRFRPPTPGLAATRRRLGGPHPARL